MTATGDVGVVGDVAGSAGATTTTTSATPCPVGSMTLTVSSPARQTAVTTIAIRKPTAATPPNRRSQSEDLRRDIRMPWVFVRRAKRRIVTQGAWIRTAAREAVS